MDNEQRLKALERRRRHGACLLAAGVKPAEVARRTKVSRQSVSRWRRWSRRVGWRRCDGHGVLVARPGFPMPNVRNSCGS